MKILLIHILKKMNKMLINTIFNKCRISPNRYTIKKVNNIILILIKFLKFFKYLKK